MFVSIAEVKSIKQYVTKTHMKRNCYGIVMEVQIFKENTEQDRVIIVNLLKKCMLSGSCRFRQMSELYGLNMTPPVNNKYFDPHVFSILSCSLVLKLDVNEVCMNSCVNLLIFESRT